MLSIQFDTSQNLPSVQDFGWIIHFSQTFKALTMTVFSQTFQGFENDNFFTKTFKDLNKNVEYPCPHCKQARRAQVTSVSLNTIGGSCRKYGFCVSWQNRSLVCKAPAKLLLRQKSCLWQLPPMVPCEVSQQKKCAALSLLETVDHFLMTEVTKVLSRQKWYLWQLLPVMRYCP